MTNVQKLDCTHLHTFLDTGHKLKNSRINLGGLQLIKTKCSHRKFIGKNAYNSNLDKIDDNLIYEFVRVKAFIQTTFITHCGLKSFARCRLICHSY